MTWVSPGGGTRNELDYICINTRWRSSLLDVRSYRGADVGSDHFLVVGKIRLKLKKVEKVQPKRPYAVDKLKNNNVSESFREELKGGGTNKERWITDHTWKLIDERKVAKIKREQKRRLRSWRMEDEEYRRLDREVKKSCRNDKRRWLEEKAREAQEAAEKNNTKTLYRIVRELTSSRSSSGVPTRSKDGRALLTDEEQEARCLRSILRISWRDHITNEEEKENGWTRTPTAKRKTGKCGNGLDARRWKEEEREAKKDMETDSEGRPKRDGCQLARSKKGRQRPE
ncbi:Craniofacial development protein 2 [Merluccius polli]|uniref:Craniofacial development protein 2 n=1 Tax=Merluccius polli TaxID=89951 RepID=A0AA47P7R1_MERPO|nr:Craniofacial development protein 2 [Merluccius polli]